MIKALYTSATGLAAQQALLDNTANNLANANTTAFKRSQVDFHDLLYETIRPAMRRLAPRAPKSPPATRSAAAFALPATRRFFPAGATATTNNPLNVAIDGDGFFKVTLPSGDFRYTRDGSFSMNSTGNIVTADGFSLTPGITVPQDTIQLSIGTDGTVSALTSGSPSKPTVVGSITLTRFANPAGLSSEGRNLYAATAASGTPQDGVTPGVQGTGTLQQSALEQSNVDVVAEMVNLITAQRAYELNTRAIKVADDMLSTANDIAR